ncbi:hypothetical protein VTN49DRAFT_976 [Thermomyces lanuginosus]|uniref:uncharacterized protein n=1 Tax=Thermomyces lanuginosus TaxID=5541 RepID=UPI003742A54D
MQTETFEHKLAPDLCLGMLDYVYVHVITMSTKHPRTPNQTNQPRVLLTQRAHADPIESPDPGFSNG